MDDARNNYLLCVSYFPGKIGISAADVTTGDYYLTEGEDIRKLQDEIKDTVKALPPRSARSETLRCQVRAVSSHGSVSGEK